MVSVPCDISSGDDSCFSEAMSVKRYKTVNYRMSKSIQLTFIMGFIFSAIFMLFPDTIGDLIYRKENIGHILYLSFIFSRPSWA